MKKFLFILLLLFPVLLQLPKAQAAQVGDTLKYRVAYYPTWAYGDIAPWDIDWGGLTHVVLFTNGSTTTTPPYWLPVASKPDSLEIEFGFSNGDTHYLDSLTTICHRKGIKVMTTIQCVGIQAFDYIATDSARTQLFHNTLKAWMIRKHIDGWDLDLEGDPTSTIAQRVRFFRIGRRVGYDAAFPNGRALIGLATGRGDEANWPAAQMDSMMTFYDMQCYTYQWMWNGSANATWFQTPVASPASCANCENSSLSKDFLYGGASFIQGYINNGHDRSKFVVGYSTSCVTGFTGTDQLSAPWSNNYSDNSLVTVEAMVNYGGTWTHDATAKASYIHGTATSGNPMGFGAGTKFFLPFEDSTDMKAGIDYLKSVGAGGVMFYDIYGDRRVNATPNWKKTPYIYAASVYAARLNGGAAPMPDPTITVTPSSLSFGNVIVNTTNQLSFTVSGSNLTPATGNITITAPTGYTVSKTSGSGYASSITCAYTNNTLSTITIYVLFSPTTLQNYTGAITNAGGGANQSVAVTGTGVSTITPMLTVSPSSRAFGNVILGTTSELTYTISGSDLTPASGSITITPPSGYQVSLTSGSGFISPLNVSYTGGTLSTTTIYVRFSPTALTDYIGTITNAGGSATTQNVSVTGTGVAAATPTLTVDPSSIAFGNVAVTTTSILTYTLNATNLTPLSGNVTITTSSSRFQISQSSGSGFNNTRITVAYTGGTITAKTIYVRFRPNAVTDFSATIRNTGGGATTQNVAVTGTGIATTPTLTVNPTSRAFGNVIVGTTFDLTYTVGGSNLTPTSGSIAITPPSGYQVSVTSGSGFTSSLNVPYTGSTLASTTIYVRFSPTSLQSYPGNITNSGGGATVNVAVTGTGITSTSPNITVNPISLAFDNVIVNTTSSEKTYTVQGSNLLPTSGSITVTAPTGYEVSKTPGTGFASSITYSYTGGTLSSTTIYVHFNPTIVQSYPGDITNSGGGATANVAVTGTGITSASPNINVNPGSLAFDNVIVNTTSSEKTYTVQGSNLLPTSGSITVTAPTGYEVSKTPGTGFASSIVYSYTSGTLSSTTIYVHFNPTIVQSYPGDITNSGGGATTNVAVTGTGISSASPNITINPGSLAFSTVRISTTSSEQTYTLEGSNLLPTSGYITVTAPTGYEVSKTSVTGFASSILYSYTGGTLSSTTVYVHFKPTVVQSYPGTITNSGGGAPTQNIAVTGTGVSYTTSALTVNPTSLSFGNVIFNTTSELSYALTGINLLPAADSLTITAPSGFTLSNVSGSGFTSSLRIAYANRILYPIPKIIYVRFSPTTVQSYYGNITNSGGSAGAQIVAVSGNGVNPPPPILTVNPTSLSFGNVIINQTSSAKAYILTGSNLSPASGNVTINAPTGFQVSSTSNSGFNSSLNISYVASTLSPTTIYVQFSPLSVQSYSDIITNSGGSATIASVPVSGNGVEPIITVSPQSLSFASVVLNDTSSERTYTLTGSNITPASGSITITTPSGYQVSLISGSGFGSTINVPYSEGTISSPVTIFVRFLPTGLQNYTGNITNIGGGATAQNVSVSGVGVSATAPLIRTDPTSLSFDSVIIGTTSAERTYTLSGLHLLPAIDSLTMTAPSGFTISTVSGSGFTSSKRIAYTGGTFSAKTIYVRFTPTEVKDYSNNITNAGGSAAPQNVYVSGIGVTPTLTVYPASLPFGDVVINTPSKQQYMLSGSYLQPANDTVRITAPTGFTISTASDSGFNSSINLPYTNSTLSSTTIYVRFLPMAVQSYSGNIMNAGGGATTQNVLVSGESITPSLTISSSLVAFGNVLINTTSAESTYTIKGSNLAPLSGNIKVTTPSGFEVSKTSGSDFNSFIYISYTSGTLSSTTIYVRFSPVAVQSYSGNITNDGGGTTTQNVTVSGTGVSNASLSISTASLSFGSVTINAISREKSYTLSGTNLIVGRHITITSSKGFQVSATSGSGFDSSFSVSPSSDTLSSRSVYVRFSPTAVENYNGNITNAADGATTLDVAVSGIGLPSDEIVQLGQNYPNPFNPNTRIPYSVYKKSWVKLTIYNILGQRMMTLIDGEQDVGYYQPEFDISRTNNGEELSSGVYFYRLEIGGTSFTKKLLLLK